METLSPWALILAGDEGTRRRPQRLEQTLRRTRLLVPRDCTLAVVGAAQARSYAPLLSNLSPDSVAVQPENRGTAAAVVYGLLRIMTAVAKGPAIIVPSDHSVSNDAGFVAHAETAIQAVVARPDLLVLLGTPPDSGEANRAWIEPGERIAGPWQPELHRARRGRLWDGCVMVGFPCAFLNLVRSAAPALIDAFAPVRARLGTPWEASSLRQAYARLPSLDFGEVVKTYPANLAMI